MNHEEEEAPIIKLSWLRDSLPFVMLVVSGLVWGMKLESRYDRNEAVAQALQVQVNALQVQLNKGILPVTEERINALTRRVDVVEKNCQEERAHGP